MKEPSPIHRIPPSAFIQAIADPEITLDQCAAFDTVVHGGWHTEPRIPGQFFGVNYCFYSATAELKVSLSNRTERVSPNTLCWFPPGVFYEIAMQSNRQRESLKRLRFRLHQDGEQLTPFEEFTAVPRASFCEHDILRCAGAFEDTGAYGNLRRRSEVSLFAMNVCESIPKQNEDTSPGHAMMIRLERFVAERIATWPTTQELAKVAGYNPAYFARLMRQQTGLPPRKWLVDRRIRFAARRLLESHQDIQSIANECGYDNPFFFSRQFKDIMGTSPRIWRKQNFGSGN